MNYLRYTYSLQANYNSAWAKNREGKPGGGGRGGGEK